MISLEHQIFDPCAIDRPEPVRPKPVAMPFKTFLEACRPKLTNTEIAETIPTQIIADHLTNALRFGANRTIVPDVLRHAMKYYESQVSAQPPRRKGKVKRAAKAFPHSYWSSYARSPRRSNARVLAETIRRHYVRIQKGIVIRFLLHAPASRLAGSKPKSSRPSEALEKQWIWIWKRGSVKGHFPVQMVTNQPFWSRPCPAKLFDSNGHVFSNPTGPTMFSHLRRCDRDSLAHIAILTTSKCASRMSAVMTSL